jgi:hypothetical protein
VVPAVSGPEWPGPAGVAVLVPCRDEELTVGAVVQEFSAALPGAEVWVCDNASTDATAEVARRAGARVLRATPAGKGHAVRRLLADVEADVYLMVDGDGTYDPAAAPLLVRAVLEGGADLANAVRVPEGQGALSRAHAWGNRALTWLVSRLFRRQVSDPLSGYKALSRRFAKSFPVFSRRFEVEVEMTVHTLELSMPVADVACPYRARPQGSRSKLRTWRDGARIVWQILGLVRQEKPLAFFSAIAGCLAAAAVGLAVPIISTYFRTHQVPRLPTAVLVTGMMLLAFLLGTAGLVLDTVSRGRREAKMLAYLAVPPPTSLAPDRGVPAEVPGRLAGKEMADSHTKPSGSAR